MTPTTEMRLLEARFFLKLTSGWRLRRAPLARRCGVSMARFAITGMPSLNNWACESPQSVSFLFLKANSKTTVSVIDCWASLRLRLMLRDESFLVGPEGRLPALRALHQRI